MGSCSTKIVVVPKPPDPEPEKPVCTLAASPGSVQLGNSATLGWTSQGANRLAVTPLDAQGAPIGPSEDMTPVGEGSRTISPTQTTQFSGQAIGDTTISYCNASIVVTAPPPPTCNLALNPLEVPHGGTTTLSWKTTYASKLHLWFVPTATGTGSGLGDATPVAEGSIQLGAYQNGYVHGEATGLEGASPPTVICTSDVLIVGPPPEPPSGSYVLDDNGNILTADWVPPCVPPESGEWQCATSPYPPGEKLTDYLEKQGLVVRGRP